MSVLPAFELHRPASLDEALSALSFDDMPLAGGTELLLAMRMRVLRPTSLVDLKQLPELRGITMDGDELSIGGSVTHRQASRDELVGAHLPVLPGVLEQVGNPRVRASGTLAGNLVFAEPKSDVIPILQALGARIELRSTEGTRQLGIGDFVLGPYWSAREPDELVTRVIVPLGHVVAAAYEKFQTMERPTVGVAAVDRRDGSRSIVVGAVTAPPLVHETTPDATVDGHEIAAAIEYVADVTGSERYKRHVTGVTIDRAVAALDQAHP